MEAEYMALMQGQSLPVYLNADNHSSIALAEWMKGHAWAKHIHIRQHYIHEQVTEGNIKTLPVVSTESLTNIFNKLLG
ncbi:hypothetical protein C0989_003976 [Termitomyces sp. Mn162]|nr:hypothetical protein C0989_003976 [Termitomyces sp. Mn162]